MQVNFYYNQSDYRYINKVLQEGKSFEGVLRDECSVMNPVIMFESQDVLRYNYCYIPEFQRYYAVTRTENYRNGLWLVYMEVDVLMSFRRDILRHKCIVSKQTMPENGDEYIDDGSLVMDSVMFSSIYNFPDGFNEQPTYILITAG